MGVYHVQAPAPRGEKRTRCGRRIVWFQGLMVIKPADWERGTEHWGDAAVQAVRIGQGMVAGELDGGGVGYGCGRGGHH